MMKFEDAPLPVTSWAMQMRALSTEKPTSLVQTLTGAILGCGGWVLSRGANDAGTISVLFEFERRTCLEIYSVLVGAGLELSQCGHNQLTELCRCTRLHPKAFGDQVASIELEILTYPVQMKGESRLPEVA
ncbi:MAG TPA: hypothetical protein VMV57_11915 [Terracidiphilus sp.]|nr:hypothetical protein [Terracidiphilus sp.]